MPQKSVLIVLDGCVNVLAVSGVVFLVVILVVEEVVGDTSEPVRLCEILFMLVMLNCLANLPL
jgi:hypothetical protein